MKTELQPLYATKTATYDRVIVDGRVHPLTAPASVTPGDMITVVINGEYPLLDDVEVVWVEQGSSLSAAEIIDHHAKELALRRPA